MRRSNPADRELSCTTTSYGGGNWRTNAPAACTGKVCVQRTVKATAPGRGHGSPERGLQACLGERAYCRRSGRGDGQSKLLQRKTTVQRTSPGPSRLPPSLVATGALPIEERIGGGKR